MRTMFFLFIIAVVTALLTPIFGQPVDPTKLPSEADVLIQKGRYFTVTVLPGRPLRVFVAGREKARLDIADLKLEVVSAGEKLEVNRDGTSYVITPPQAPESTTLEIRTRLRENTEVFRIHLKGKP